MKQDNSNFLAATEQAEVAAQFLAQAILTAHGVLYGSDAPTAGQTSKEKIEEHLDCARAHYAAMIELRSRDSSDKPITHEVIADEIQRVSDMAAEVNMMPLAETLTAMQKEVRNGA